MVDDGDSPRPAADSLAEARDLLYGLTDLDRFVEVRNELAKAIRTGGDRQLANTVKGLRKPSVLAAELNRVLRADPTVTEELLAGAEELQDGHRTMADGGTVDLAGLRAAHRARAERLVAGAERDHDRLIQVLEAAALDPSCHDDLRSAAFVAEPTPSLGFELLPPATTTAPLASVTSMAGARARRAERTAADDQDHGDPSAPAPSTDAPSPKAPAAETSSTTRPTTPSPPVDSPTDDPGDDEAIDEDRARRADAAVAAAATEHDKADAGLALAYRRVEAAVKKHAKAIEREAELERRLTEARDNLSETERSLAAARTAAERAETSLSTTAQALRDARTAAGQPEQPAT